MEEMMKMYIIVRTHTWFIYYIARTLFWMRENKCVVDKWIKFKNVGFITYVQNNKLEMYTKQPKDWDKNEFQIKVRKRIPLFLNFVMQYLIAYISYMFVVVDCKI